MLLWCSYDDMMMVHTCSLSVQMYTTALLCTTPLYTVQAVRSSPSQQMLRILNQPLS